MKRNFLCETAHTVCTPSYPLISYHTIAHHMYRIPIVPWLFSWQGLAVRVTTVDKHDIYHTSDVDLSSEDPPRPLMTITTTMKEVVQFAPPPFVGSPSARREVSSWCSGWRSSLCGTSYSPSIGVGAHAAFFGREMIDFRAVTRTCAWQTKVSLLGTVPLFVCHPSYSCPSRHLPTGYGSVHTQST